MTAGYLGSVQGDARHSAVGNAVSDAIHSGMAAGLSGDEAVSVAANVVVDYWRELNFPIEQLLHLIQIAALAKSGFIRRQ